MPSPSSAQASASPGAVLAGKTAMTQPPRLYIDIDGVFADYAAAVERLVGIRPDDMDRTQRADAWKAIIAEGNDFWASLARLPGTEALGQACVNASALALTGSVVGLDECVSGKKTWCEKELKLPPKRTLVVKSQDKFHWCRPGDVLLDDTEKNIKAWRCAGGIGILHRSPDESLRRLNDCGILDGPESPEWTARRKICEMAVRRIGYTAWRIAEADRKRLRAAFPTFSGLLPGRQPRYVCAHVTRRFPAGNDVPDAIKARVEILGEIKSPESGHHVLICSVDGKLERPQGGVHHLTHALDDSPATVAATKRPRPTAGGSNAVIAAALEKADGRVETLLNLSAERRISLEAEYVLLPTLQGTEEKTHAAGKRALDESIANSVLAGEPLSLRAMEDAAESAERRPKEGKERAR
jgi:hypothetical protein